MNVLFFLTPKTDVAYVHDSDSVRQAMEKMDHYKYSAVPIISEEGEYKGTITEGDILWKIKADEDFNIKKMEDVSVMSINRRVDNHTVNINTDVEDLVLTSLNQNFIPVVDDEGIVIGMVKRRDIIEYFFDTLIEPKRKAREATKKEDEK